MPNERTIDNLIYTSIIVCSISISVAEAKRQPRSGRILILVDHLSRPVGICTNELLDQLPNVNRPLDEYQTRFALPTTTMMGTPLMVILHGFDYDESIRWHVVYNRDQIVGVLNPDDLLKEFPKSSPWLDPDSTPSPLPIFGNSLAAPPNLCYSCNHQQPHRIAPETVEQRTIEGHALCPIHQTIMLAENPCREKQR